MPKYKNRNKAPNVVGGGVAIPLGNNLYYMAGRKHETGGIDVGRDLEVEDGEIMQMRNNDVRVFSAQPIINGHSPAELVRYGGNPNDVFNAQERYKDRNRINDDGSRYKCGGRKKRLFGSDEQRTDAITDYRPVVPEAVERVVRGTPWSQLSSNERNEIKILEKRWKNNAPLEIVSPEFDIISGVRAAFNAGNSLLKSIVGNTAETAAYTAAPELSLVSLPANIIRGKIDKALNNTKQKTLPAISSATNTTATSRKINEVNVLESSGKVTRLPATTPTQADKNREWIRRFNKWNKRYGYPPVDLNLSMTPNELDAAVQNRLIEHNTFVRGVKDVKGEQRENLNNILVSQGIEPTRDNRLKYMATRFSPPTGAGRAKFKPRYAEEGPIYTSNSLHTGNSYATPIHRGEMPGGIVVVRRPVDFSSPNRNDWIYNADIPFDNQESVNYSRFGLPYLMETGRSLNSDLTKGININYDDIKERFRKQYRLPVNNSNNDVIIGNYNTTVTNELNEKLNLVNDYANKLGIKYKPRFNVFSKNDITAATEARLMEDYIYNAQHLEYLRNQIGDGNVVDPILYDDYKTLERKLNQISSRRYRENKKKDLEKVYKQTTKNDIARQYVQYTNNLSNIESQMKQYGVAPNNIFYDNDINNPETYGTNMFTTENLKTTTRNSPKKDVYQHMIFRGRIGEQGLEPINIITPFAEENISRMHWGDYTPGLSRNTKKVGGMKRNIKRNGGIVSINGNVKDGLIYWANPSTGGRHKAAVGTRMLGLDRTIAVLNQSRISGVKPTNKQVDKPKENTKPEPIAEPKRNSSVSLSDISDTGAGIGIGGMTAYGLYKLGTNPKVTQGVERGLTVAADKIQSRMDKANKYYTAPREVIDRYNRMKINRINRGFQSIRDKAVSLALEEVDEPVANTSTRTNIPSKFRTRVNQVVDRINGSETARNIASRFKTGAKNFGKFMDRIGRDASSKLKGVGYIGIIDDLIKNFNATEKDDRQQRLNLYYSIGDISFLKDGDLTDKDMVRCGGKRKKADLGTSNNDRTLSTPLFSLFGPRYDRVLEINYGDNGVVNSYNGIDRDLGNPSAGFRDNLNNGYYDMGIDYFNNRRYNYTRPTDDTVAEEVTNSAEVAPRRRVATSPAPNSLGAAPTPLSSEPIPLTIPASNAPVPTINQKSVEALRTPSTTDDGHYAGMFGPITATDWISLGGNLLGSLGSWFAGRANPEFNYIEPDRPIMEQPVRMVTTYNNRPQIANIEQNVRRSMRDISGNTGSSRAALQRMQRVRNAGTQGINQLEAEKENIETQLRNADAANRQRVRARNVSAYNEYLSQRNRLRNAKNTIDYENKMRRINNNVGLINNLNISLQDFLKGINQRNQFNNTLGYLRGASPNVDDRIFRDMGVNFSRMFNTNNR